MFVSKRRFQELKEQHAADTAALQNVYERQISQLQDRIADLRRLVFPERPKEEIPPVAAELDAVISASEKPPEMSEQEMNRMIAGAREMDLLMSGNYDEDLLSQ